MKSPLKGHRSGIRDGNGPENVLRASEAHQGSNVPASGGGGPAAGS